MKSDEVEKSTSWLASRCLVACLVFHGYCEGMDDTLVVRQRVCSEVAAVVRHNVVEKCSLRTLTTCGEK